MTSPISLLAISDHTCRACARSVQILLDPLDILGGRCRGAVLVLVGPARPPFRHESLRLVEPLPPALHSHVRDLSGHQNSLHRVDRTVRNRISERQVRGRPRLDFQQPETNLHDADTPLAQHFPFGVGHLPAVPALPHRDVVVHRIAALRGYGNGTADGTTRIRRGSRHSVRVAGPIDRSPALFDEPPAALLSATHASVCRANLVRQVAQRAGQVGCGPSAEQFDHGVPHPPEPLVRQIPDRTPHPRPPRRSHATGTAADLIVESPTPPHSGITAGSITPESGRGSADRPNRRPATGSDTPRTVLSTTRTRSTAGLGNLTAEAGSEMWPGSTHRTGFVPAPDEPYRRYRYFRPAFRNPGRFRLHRSDSKTMRPAGRKPAGRIGIRSIRAVARPPRWRTAWRIRRP